MSAWGNLSAIGMLAIIAMMYFTGLIVPRKSFKDMERQRDHYEEAYNKIRDKYDQLMDSKIEANTEALRLVRKSFESLDNRGS
jgi:hypothetical protein